MTSVAADGSEAAMARAGEALRRATEELAREGVAAEGTVRAGAAHEEIVAAAAEHGVDLIIVGRRGASGAVHRALLGSTAQKVVGLAACPVLVVRT